MNSSATPTGHLPSASSRHTRCIQRSNTPARCIPRRFARYTPCASPSLGGAPPSHARIRISQCGWGHCNVARILYIPLPSYILPTYPYLSLYSFVKSSKLLANITGNPWLSNWRAILRWSSLMMPPFALFISRNRTPCLAWATIKSGVPGGCSLINVPRVTPLTVPEWRRKGSQPFSFRKLVISLVTSLSSRPPLLATVVFLMASRTKDLERGVVSPTH